MAVDKITSPATPLEVVNKINEVIDNQCGGGGGSITVDDAISSTSTNPVQNKVIYTALSGKQATSNLVTSLSSSSTDAQYPSAKCVYDIVGDIESAINTIRGV